MCNFPILCSIYEFRIGMVQGARSNNNKINIMSKKKMPENMMISRMKKAKMNAKQYKNCMPHKQIEAKHKIDEQTENKAAKRM